MNKERKTICIITICLFLCALTIFCLNYQTFTKPVNEKSGFIWEVYDFYAENYQDDPIILHVSNYCNQFEDKVPCVYEVVPYEYHDSPHFFVTPSEYWKRGGVCRDKSLMIKSTLNNLNISCGYVFSPTHVYLTCSENGNIYILDNTLEVIKNE